MKLRKLKQKDAPLMLGWMHDDSVVHDMGRDFSKRTLNDCQAFIDLSQTDCPYVYCAIVDDTDEYMGMVNWKNVDPVNKNAEFAITIRKTVMEKGYFAYGMKQIIRLIFEKYDLEIICWYVSKRNHRSICFYKKNGYKQIDYSMIYIVEYSNQICFVAERAKTEYRGYNPSFCREQRNCLTA